MNDALWIAVAALVALLAVMQFVGVRALGAWGVRPSGLVLALRVVNYVLLVGVLAFAFVKTVM